MQTSHTVHTVADMRRLRASDSYLGRTIGFVPTMGALHEGHLSLIRAAKRENDIVVVSIYVNPLQFNDQQDLAAYPHDLNRDIDLAEPAGADVVFAPTSADMYPEGFRTSVQVDALSEPMEGQSRGPAHFRGVTTVVAKLFNVVQPTNAYFGQKDFQQGVIIGQMIRDLNFAIRLHMCPTVREADGLAMSSRNVRLTPAERQRAVGLYLALQASSDAVRRGEYSSEALQRTAVDVLRGVGIQPEYVSVASTRTLEPLAEIADEAVIALAAKVGSVRLIDNMVVSRPQ